MFFGLFGKKKGGNIWGDLKNQKPEGFLALAPMLDVTDKPFREIVADLGAPDIFFTEFVSVDGLASAGGRKRLIKMLAKTDYEKKHHNLVFQIFGSDPEKFSQAIEVIKKLKPAGIDINTGCPVKAIIKQNAGSALIKTKNRDLVKQICLASKEACGDIPLSIKTRIGFGQIDLDWIEFLFKLQPDALIVHFRTQKEMSKVPAHWGLAKKIVEMRNKFSSKTVLVGNGDVESVAEAKEKIAESGFDGVMIGRGIFQNSKLFVEGDFNALSLKEKLKIMFKHLDLYEKEFFIDGK